MIRKKPIYLDYQATTPVDPRVLDEMMPYLTDQFGNASSKENEYGWAADAAVEVARKRVASLIGAEAEEIYFTSGATESSNLAILGLYRASDLSRKHFVTTEIEHPAVLGPIGQLESQGADVYYLSVDSQGRVDLNDLRDSIHAETICVAIMYANNEMGTIQNVREIGSICSKKGTVFFSDLAQAMSTQKVNVKELGIHMASFSSHKMYGPKGVGALYVSRKNPRVKIEPICFGGGQERGVRPGTLNVPAIVGFGKAADLLVRDREKEKNRLISFRERFVEKLRTIPSLRINGDPESCLPHSVSFTVSGVTGESLLMASRELAYSSGSACASAKIEPSHVLKAIGLSEEESRSTLRVSFGRFTSEEDVDFAANLLVDSISKLKSISNRFSKSRTDADGLRTNHD